LIVKEVPNVLYVMLGLPTNKELLLKRANELGVSNNVYFPGVRSNEELIYWYNSCDVFAMTSVYTNTGDFEGFGIAVIEAALCGKPAIVSDNSGLVEAVENGVTGIVVKEKDTLSTSLAAIRFFKEKYTLDAMGKAAFLRASNYYSWEKRVKDYHKEFSAFIKK
jgi:phosphatidyl-myo-inositol dimannoside synthase